MEKRKGHVPTPPRSLRFPTWCKPFAPHCCALERSQMNRWNRQANKRFYLTFVDD